MMCRTTSVKKLSSFFLSTTGGYGQQPVPGMGRGGYGMGGYGQYGAPGQPPAQPQGYGAVGAPGAMPGAGYGYGGECWRTTEKGERGGRGGRIKIGGWSRE